MTAATAAATTTTTLYTEWRNIAPVYTVCSVYTAQFTLPHSFRKYWILSNLPPVQDSHAFIHQSWIPWNMFVGRWFFPATSRVTEAARMAELGPGCERLTEYVAGTVGGAIGYIATVWWPAAGRLWSRQADECCVRFCFERNQRRMRGAEEGNLLECDTYREPPCDGRVTVLTTGEQTYRAPLFVFVLLKPAGRYTYRTVVTICTTSLTYNSSTFCPHTVFMCFVWIWEQTAIISLYNINWLVFITEI